jgi:hypothetical protein
VDVVLSDPITKREVTSWKDSVKKVLTVKGPLGRCYCTDALSSVSLTANMASVAFLCGERERERERERGKRLTIEFTSG